jgi:hypothetical protein
VRAPPPPRRPLLPKLFASTDHASNYRSSHDMI